MDEERKDGGGKEEIIKKEKEASNQKADNGKSNEEEAVIDEMIKEAPPEIKRSLMAISQSFSRGFPTHPLFDKFNAEHINKFLDGIQTDDNNEYKLKSSNRIFYLIYVLLGIGVFVFLITYLLPKDRDLLITILQVVVIFGAGFGSGYGFKSRRNKKN